MQFISAKVDIRYLPDDMASAFFLFEEEKFPLRLTNRLNYLKYILHKLKLAGAAESIIDLAALACRYS